MEEVQKKRSPWLYVGLGCLATIVFGCLGSAIAAKVACNGVQQAVEDLKDQSKQELKATHAAQEMLGGIPVGYYPVFSFGIPFVIDMLVFIDQKPVPDAAITPERMLYFTRIIETDQAQGLRDYFAGTGDASSLRRNNLNVEAKSEIGRGELTIKERKMSWVTIRGRIQMNGPYDSGQDAIVALMLFDCPKDGKLRTAMWQMRDEEQTDMKGTVADPDEIAKLLQPLSPCGK
jgi:hypothetical protein